jgi:hypothetical protein
VALAAGESLGDGFVAPLQAASATAATRTAIVIEDGRRTA